MSADRKPKGGGLARTVNLFLIIVILVLIPLTLEQLEEYPEALPWVGRVCAGLALVFLAHAVIKRSFRLLAILLVAGIVLAVLVSEGYIDPPRLIIREK